MLVNNGFVKYYVKTTNGRKRGSRNTRSTRKKNLQTLIKRDIKMLKYEKYLAKIISFDTEKIKILKIK